MSHASPKAKLTAAPLSRRARKNLTAVALLAICAAPTACHDSSSPTAPGRQPASPVMQVSIDPNEDTWDYYSADVSVTRDAGVNTANVTNGATYSTYHIVRTLSGNTWSSSVSFDPLPSMGMGTTPDASIDPAQLQTDDQASYVQLTNRNGVLENSLPSVSQYPVLPPPSGHDPLPAFPSPPPGVYLSRMIPGGTRLIAPSAAVLPPSSRSAAQADPRGWIANVLITPRSRAKLVAARERRFGQMIGKVGALERYLHSRNGTTFEELVDPNHGGAVERNLSVNGKLVFHTTRSFASIGNGMYVLTSEDIQYQPLGTSHILTRHVTFNNVHLEKRGQ